MGDEHFLSSLSLELEQKHVDLIEWAKERAVIINGVKPAHLPHKGVGIIATRPLKVDTSESNWTLRSKF